MKWETETALNMKQCVARLRQVASPGGLRRRKVTVMLDRVAEEGAEFRAELVSGLFPAYAALTGQVRRSPDGGCRVTADYWVSGLYMAAYLLFVVLISPALFMVASLPVVFLLIALSPVLSFVVGLWHLEYLLGVLVQVFDEDNAEIRL